MNPERRQETFVQPGENPKLQTPDEIVSMINNGVGRNRALAKMPESSLRARSPEFSRNPKTRNWALYV